MTLSTMDPNPAWDPAANANTVDAFDTLSEGITVHVWGADWCGDCRAVLPDFAAALDAAEVPADSIRVHEVDRDKQGELVDQYGIEYIPTVVVTRHGDELARFVEDEDRPAATYLAEQLRDRDPEL